MNILTRYVLFDVAKVFCVTLISMTLLLLIYGVARQAVEEGLGFAQIVRLIPYLLPDSLRFTLPGTALFSVSIVYGRLAATNEVVAVKSLGIHPMVLLTPVLVAGVLLSLITVVMYDLAVSWGHRGVQRVVVEAAEEIAYGMLRRHKSMCTDQFTMTVKGVDGRRLIMPTMVFRGSNSPSLTVTAEEAELRCDSDAGMLTFIIRNGTATGKNVRYAFPYEERQVPMRGDPKANLPSRMPLRALPDAIRKCQAEIDEHDRERTATLACQWLVGEFGSLANVKQLQLFARVRAALYENLYRLRTESYRRWATGFGCFCFMLVGAALAIRRRNSDLLTSFFLCFAPILVVYYPVFIMTIDHAKGGGAPWLIWTGNIVLLVWGLWLVRRVVRY